MQFLPYQKRWILDESPIKLYEKSRRAGITYATSYRACRKCIRSGKNDSTFVQWVSSRDEITAKEFVTDYVAHWAREANKEAREIAKQWDGVIGLDGKNIEVVDEKKGITAMVVKFKNGARIYSLSSNPLAFAGKGGDVLIDEWDLHPEQATIYDMAFPCTIMGNQLELVSAYDPDGSENTECAKLCRACKNGLRKDISFYSTTILDAINDGYVEMVNEVKRAKGRPTQTREEFLASIKKGCRTIDAFNSQFMCIPNKASGEQLIAAGDLTAAQGRFEILFRRFENGVDSGDFFDAIFWARIFGNARYAIGVDIARTGDLTSIFVNRKDAEMYRLYALVTMKNCKFALQEKIIGAMFESSYSIVGCGDKTGLGMAMCESLEDRFLERFTGINFGASKVALGTTMQSIYEQRRQLIPIDRPEISADIAGIKKASTAGGKLTFTEEKNELLPDSHCDIGWSNALSIYAGETIDNFGPCNLEPCAILSEARCRRNDFNEPNRMKHHEISKTAWPV